MFQGNWNGKGSAGVDFAAVAAVTAQVLAAKGNWGQAYSKGSGNGGRKGGDNWHNGEPEFRGGTSVGVRTQSTMAMPKLQGAQWQGYPKPCQQNMLPQVRGVQTKGKQGHGKGRRSRRQV
jgi:hypothetical protein